MTAPTIGELLARLEEQQARIELLEAKSAAPAASLVADASVESDPCPAKMTRRGMLKAAAVGSVGLVGAILVESEGAASATGAPGPGTFASKTSRAAVKATNTGSGNAILAISGTETAIHGSQTSPASDAVAVRGSIDSKTPGAGTGVVGEGPGTGVRGSSAKGTGVAGTSAKGIGIAGTSASTAADAAAVQGTITSTSPGNNSAGVRGINNGTDGTGIGVYGSQNGSGNGVYGYAPNGSGVVGESGDNMGVHGIATAGGFGVRGDTSDGNGYGVYGEADGGTGVYGLAVAGAGVGGSSSSGTGVDGSSSSGTGVDGSSGSGTAVRGASSGGYGVYGSSSSNYAVLGVTTSGNGVYGQVSTAGQAGVVGRQLDVSGNWAIYGFGNIGASGTKSAVVPTEDGTGYVTLYCVESPECWFEDFGSARLSNGVTSVVIDPEFAQTVQTGQYHVFLQAEGDCKGLSVLDKTATGFVVRELEGGTSDVPFAYRIVALRRDVSAPRLNRVTLPEAPMEAR